MTCFSYELGWVVKGTQFGNSLRMKCKSNQANTDLRVEWLISPRKWELGMCMLPRDVIHSPYDLWHLFCAWLWGEQEKSDRVLAHEGP